MFVKNTDLFSAVYIVIVLQGSFGKLVRPHGEIESYKFIKSILKVTKLFSSQISEEWENYQCLALRRKKNSLKNAVLQYEKKKIILYL